MRIGNGIEFKKKSFLRHGVKFSQSRSKTKVEVNMKFLVSMNSNLKLLHWMNPVSSYLKIIVIRKNYN